MSSSLQQPGRIRPLEVPVAVLIDLLLVGELFAPADAVSPLLGRAGRFLRPITRPGRLRLEWQQKIAVSENRIMKKLLQFSTVHCHIEYVS
jgi:hypothetical protein